MADKKLTTSWTWLDGDEIRGLIVDVDDGLLRWHDQIGCHCTGDDFIQQAAPDFRQNGVPPLIGPLPADVAAELDQTLLMIEQR